MKSLTREISLVIAIVILGGTFMGIASSSGLSVPPDPLVKIIELPEPIYKGGVSVEEALSKRRSVRTYSSTPLSLEEITQLLWSAQGISHSNGRKRTAPSAGASYPLEVYLAVSRVDGIGRGIYRYIPQVHSLVPWGGAVTARFLKEEVSPQGAVKSAPAVLILSAHYDRVTEKYGQRGERYAHMEAGHAAQNVYLQAYSLGIGTVAIGAFNDEKLREILNLEEEEVPLYLMPVGRR